MKCRTGRVPVEDPPKTSRGVGTSFEMLVEWQFGSVTLLRKRRLSQPQPMLRPTNAQENMPAVRRLPDFASGHFGQTEPIAIAIECTPHNRNDCRENFRCPEDGLILR